ncbi:putative apoptotic protease-activating factor 1 [Apostichopus japonicus]|uniref:Putative apoptotic protease-activating factor 1 n=1 Tax=Stichopus japonicus TaxID=307972 RepID=A0A2G8LAI9_STIJA|nr:putative apoptotic protease-activating factor 1 [Apostichopus japonicus]
MGIPLTEKARILLLSNKERLSRDFMAEHIVSYLVQMSAITPADMSDILDEKTERLKSAALLDMVIKKGQGAYNALYSAFKEQYSWLAPILHDGVTRDGYDSDDDQGYSTSEIQTILSKGGVPPRPRVYVDRPQLIQMIRHSLRKLKDNPGFVVVHGMGGVGKSILAAEALRDSTVLKVGKVDKGELLVKAQNLCARLDQNQSRNPPRNLEEARDRLRAILHEQYPCCLLIYDDVWSPKVLQGIDVQARILITTRDKSVTDSVAGPVYDVPLGDGGFSEAQSLRFLASWSKQEVKSLPPAAKAIAQESKGSPLILSIIGGLLSDSPHRWEFYAEKLKARNYSRLRKASTYEYRSVDEAIGTSVDELSEPLQEMYKDLAVFNPGVKIPGKVLSIYWNMPVEDVEEEIIPLVNKSLLRQEWLDSLDCMVYTIHDLLMDFLKHLVPDQKKLHTKFARRFAEHCGNKFETLEDDSYIHWHIAMHAAEGEAYDILQPVLCGWNWIVRKTEVTGPSSLLNDLINYTPLLEDGDKRMANQIKSFISVNAHLLIQRPPPDMIQLALNSEEKSPLYQMALNLIKQSKCGTYLKWVNRDNQPNSLMLASQVHDGIAHCAEFSPDGGSIVSCGEDGTVQIRDSSSAQIEKTFSGHEDDVSWCCFSPEGDLVMSCSIIGEVIIWESLTGEVVKSVPTGSSDMVVMCQFSHDSQSFGFCSLSGNIGVGDLSTFEVATHQVCNAGVSSMSFSPDDAKIIASAYDVTARVIMTHSGQEMVSYTNHKYHLVWCDFFPCGNRVASADAAEVHIWDPESGKREHMVSVKGAYILRCAISNNGKLVAGALSDCTVWLWECNTFTAVAVHHGHTSWIYSVAFDPSDERLVTAADDGTVMVWKAVTDSPANLHAA